MGRDGGAGKGQRRLLGLGAGPVFQGPGGSPLPPGIGGGCAHPKDPAMEEPQPRAANEQRAGGQRGAAQTVREMKLL